MRVVILTCCLLLTACSPAPEQRAPLSDPPTYTDAFDAAGEWDRYSSETLIMDVVDGVFRAFTTVSGQLAWSLNDDLHRDVHIEVTVDSLSGTDGALMGVLCRASVANNGRGYQFLISADGAFSIRRGVEGGSDSLVAWQNHGAIRKHGRNQLRAECTGNQLTLFVNGRRVGSARDDRYGEGAVGLLVGLAPAQSPAASSDLVYDDLRVWEDTN